MKSSTQTLIKALEILALEIESDGVANAAIAEAAGRLAELECAASERDELLELCDLLKARITQFMNDIAYVSNRVVDLEYERDALAAQVEWLAKAFSELREHHVSNFHSANPFIGNLAVHQNWRLITNAISAKNGILHDLIYKSWVDGFEASNCGFNGEYSDDEELPYVLAKYFADGIANNPSDEYRKHLRDIKAEAGRVGYLQGAKEWCKIGNENDELMVEDADQYAAKVREGGEE